MTVQYEYVLDFIQLYFTYCPISPYTDYFVFGFITLLLFCLWRRAAVKLKVVKASRDALIVAVSRPADSEAVKAVKQMHDQAVLAFFEILDRFKK